MPDIFIQNLTVLEKRWPSLADLLRQEAAELNVTLVNGLSSTLAVDGIQLSSRHDRIKEACQQMSHVLDCANIICTEENTSDFEQAVSSAKTPEEIITLFESVELKFM